MTKSTSRRRTPARGATADAFREQVLNGVKVGEHHYVRLFPVWFEFRGNHGTVLTQAKAISAAAHLRGNFELASLAQQQLQWVVGRNPFVQSTMWGEGYDYAPQYTAMSGDIVGSLPVGIQAHRNADQPYWPAENCHNWKEVWVHPVARWFCLMRDLAGPAQISGRTDQGSRQPLEFREKKTGKTTHIDPDPSSSPSTVCCPKASTKSPPAASGEPLCSCPAARSTWTSALARKSESALYRAPATMALSR